VVLFLVRSDNTPNARSGHAQPPGRSADAVRIPEETSNDFSVSNGHLVSTCHLYMEQTQTRLTSKPLRANTIATSGPYKSSDGETNVGASVEKAAASVAVRPAPEETTPKSMGRNSSRMDEIGTDATTGGFLRA